MRSVPRTASPHNPLLRARDLNRERVAIYCRVSSDEQAQAGTTQNQIEFARRYCDLHQLPIAGIYADEGVSGVVPVPDRPAGARLLADARAGRFGTVLVYRIDRLARSTRVLLDTHDALTACGVALRSMTEPFDTSSPLGEFIMTLLGSLAALERATILERMSLGKHRAAREGRWLGGAPPFGYRVEGPEHDRRLVVDEAQAAVVRRIFHLYVHEGLGLIPLAELLNAEGVPTPYQARGQTTKRWPGEARRWNTGTLSRLLRNTAYIGRYRAGARSGEGDRRVRDAAHRGRRDVRCGAAPAGGALHRGLAQRPAPLPPARARPVLVRSRRGDERPGARSRCRLTQHRCRVQTRTRVTASIERSRCRLTQHRCRSGGTRSSRTSAG
jgi:DNA invertase Pin-like site-specific DNA recombinase